MNAFEQLDPNNIAFDMLQDKDTENDIIRIGEGLLDRLHAHTHEPSPEVSNAIKTMHGYLGQLKVEFDEHFKNRITMLCHVPKIVSEGAASPGTKKEASVSPSPKPVERKETNFENLMDDEAGFGEDLTDLDPAVSRQQYVVKQLTSEADTIDLSG